MQHHPWQIDCKPYKTNEPLCVINTSFHTYIKATPNCWMINLFCLLIRIWQLRPDQVVLPADSKVTVGKMPFQPLDQLTQWSESCRDSSISLHLGIADRLICFQMELVSGFVKREITGELLGGWDMEDQMDFLSGLSDPVLYLWSFMIIHDK